MLRTRARDIGSEQGGWAVVTAIVLLSVMLIMGLGLLALVDTQAKRSGKERVNDSTFNLAEGALNAEAFLISRSWPSTAPAATTCSTTAAINGDINTSSAIQKILVASFGAHDYAAGATWKVNVCDDTNSSADTWSDTKLGSASGYDQNANGKVWIRAQTTVHGQKRAVAAMIVVQRPPLLPSNYAVLGGGFSNELTWASNQLTAGALLSPLLSGLLSQNKMINGTIGVRCGLSSGCIEGAFTALSATPLKTLLLANNTVHYGSDAALSEDALDGLRNQAKTDGTWVQTVAANGSCIPAGAGSGSIVFVEEVGDGRNDYCTISTTSNPSYRMVVVNNGRLKVQGTGTVTAVVYGANHQRVALGDDRIARGCANLANLVGDPCEVVRVEAGAHVKGSVFADGLTGDVNIYPQYTVNSSACSTVNLINVGAGLLGTATLLSTTAQVCGAGNLTLLNDSAATVNVSVQIRTILGITTTITIPITVANVGNPTALTNTLLTQVSGPPAPITYDSTTVTAITGYGSSGTVAGTFRSIPPN
jgi:Tfp pilus assembly protein PilX